jgi:hypothetical protein
LSSDEPAASWLRGIQRHWKNEAQRHAAASEELKAVVAEIDELLTAPDPKADRMASEPSLPLPGLDDADLTRLPWVPFADGRGAWIKTQAPGAELLKQQLEKTPGATIVIGGHKYKFGGPGNVFINRFSTKVTPTTEPVQK